MSTSDNSHAQNSQRKPFIGFALDRDTLESVVQAVKGLGWGPQNVLYGDVEMAVTNLKDVPTPQRVLVDLSGSEDPLADLGQLANVCDPGTQVTAIGTHNDLNLYHRIKELGVTEYLLKPIDPAQLSLTLNPPEVVRDAEESEWGNRIIAVVGAAGGAGTTTVATSLAWMIAHHEGRKTALLALDPWFGTAAFNLNLEPGNAMVEALQDPTRIDSLFIERAMAAESENFHVLSSEPDLRQAAAIRPDSAGVLIQRLAPEFDRLVLDLPRCNAGLLQGGLGQASRVLIVSDLSMTGVRDSVRLAELAEAVSPNLELGIVLNRVGDKGRGQVSEKQFRRTVGRPVFAIFPEDPKTMAAALSAGVAVPAQAPSCAMVKTIKKQWTQLTGNEARNRTPFWQRLRRSA